MTRYAIGIDLGTTNSVLAYADLEAPEAGVQVLPIPQLVAAQTVEDRSSLPSFLYLATEQETRAGSYALPGQATAEYAVGELARRRAAEVPTRTVAAAKSWLAHSRVDRHQPILPWDAPTDVGKISPITASARYLGHLVAAWNRRFPTHPLTEQTVVLTVPASFDAGARELTREAALAAGLPHDLVLLEEPQAALYAWLGHRGDAWRQELHEGDCLLVADAGGGTTDFSLITIGSEEGELTLNRLAVGDHLLVGGDNMDLTLAHLMQTDLAARGTSIDAWQSVSLWHACRQAKETLLDADGPSEHPITVLGRGSRLIGGTVSVPLDRDRAADALLDGFFPLCPLDAKPQRQRASGFRQLGLAYETDVAISRHLAHFLSRHGTDGAVRPTHILFNGGVFKATAFRWRLLELLGSWFGQDDAPRVLEDQDLDTSVAIGAAQYGVIKTRGGWRIRGGTARSYYLGIETAGLAIPGAPRPLNALCVVPNGMEEGTEVEVPGGEIGLVVGELAHFRFFSSTVRKDDTVGQVLPHWQDGELVETDSLEATLDASETVDGDFVPVRFRSKITELGLFELWCESTLAEERWKMELRVRDDG